MTLSQIMYFLAVVKYKTFTQASDELYISQSSLSKQIKALELELGHTLFNRAKENTLTAEGERFLVYANKFSKDYAAMMSDLNQMNGDSYKSPLVLGVLPIINEYNLNDDIVLFQKLIASSNSYVNLLEREQEELVNMLQFRQIDAAIIRMDSLDLSKYEYITYMEEPLVIIYPDQMEELNKEKVDTMGIRFTDENATGMLIKSKVVEGDPEVEYFRKNSAASTLNADDLSEEYFGQAKHLHVTGIPSALSTGCHEFSVAAMRYMKQQGKTISFDPNLRLKLWQDKQKMINEINELACLADLFLPGLSEAEILTGLSTPEEVADFYISKGVKTVIIKLGAKGAYYKENNEEGYINGFVVEEVVDTVGAGDGFAVGVISGLLDGKSIPEAVIRGNAIGALQVMSPGDMDGMPNRVELDEFIEKQHKVQNS